MLVVDSELEKSHESLWTYGDRPISEGDLIVEDDKITLACSKPSEISGLDRLVPLDGWIGKKIADVKRVDGSRMIFSPGSRLFSDHDGDAYVIFFQDGIKGELVAEGNMMISTFDGGLDVSPFIEAGMFSEADKEESLAEGKLYAELQEKAAELRARRTELQRSLVGESRRKEREIYDQIDQIEAELESTEAEIKNKDWRWARNRFSLEYLTNWMPDLVDLFGHKEQENRYGHRTDKMLAPYGRTIVAIHKVHDGEERSASARESCDVYVLQFEDGSHSFPLGLCEGLSLQLPLNSLRDLGLIGSEELEGATQKIVVKEALIASKQADNARLRELEKELGTHGLGLRKTRKVLEEIAVLRS